MAKVKRVKKGSFATRPNDKSVAVLMIIERANGEMVCSSNGSGYAVEMTDELLKLFAALVETSPTPTSERTSDATGAASNLADD